MLKQRPEAVDHAREAIGVARRVGDSFAELNATINLFTQESVRGIAPPDDIGSIVDAAAQAGEYEEGYRAIINFIWSASGYLPVDRIELVVSEARRRLAGVSPPRSIGPYLEVSIAMWSPGSVRSVDRGGRGSPGVRRPRTRHVAATFSPDRRRRPCVSPW